MGMGCEYLDTPFEMLDRVADILKTLMNTADLRKRRVPMWNLNLSWKVTVSFDPQIRITTARRSKTCYYFRT